jgi:hypothetical protein
LTGQLNNALETRSATSGLLFIELRSIRREYTLTSRLAGTHGLAAQAGDFVAARGEPTAGWDDDRLSLLCLISFTG